MQLLLLTLDKYLTCNTTTMVSPNWDSSVSGFYKKRQSFWCHCSLQSSKTYKARTDNICKIILIALCNPFFYNNIFFFNLSAVVIRGAYAVNTLFCYYIKRNVFEHRSHVGSFFKWALDEVALWLRWAAGVLSSMCVGVMLSSENPEGDDGESVCVCSCFPPTSSPLD